MRKTRGDSYASALASLEKPLQGGHIGQICLELQGVDAFGAKVIHQAPCLFDREFVEALAHGGATRVEFDDLSGFGVFQCENADVGKLLLARILDLDCDE